jgi:hypothetical protein
VVITGWTAARISWPRCRALDGPGGGSGILLDEELARAVRCESAAAVRFWWGVSVGVVWRWRKALAVTQTNNEGSRGLIRAASERGAAVLRGKELSDEECDARSRRAIELNLKRFLRPGYHGPRWTPEQLRQLGTAPDAVVAARIGWRSGRGASFATGWASPTPRPGPALTAARPGRRRKTTWSTACRRKKRRNGRGAPSRSSRALLGS